MPKIVGSDSLGLAPSVSKVIVTPYPLKRHLREKYDTLDIPPPVRCEVG